MARSARVFILLAALGTATVVAACGSDTTGPTPTPAAPAALEVQLGWQLGGIALPPQAQGFVRCQPRPYAQASVEIGPKGGSIKAGNHSLTIPAGALSAKTRITMRVPSDTINQVVFGPEGLRFNAGAPAMLQMDYKNCGLANGASKRIVYVNDRLQVEENLPSVDVGLTGEVAAPLKHFSRYAVAY